MIQFRERESFGAESLSRGFVGEEPGRKNLQGDVAVELLVVGAIDFTHPACADFFDNAIMSGN